MTVTISKAASEGAATNHDGKQTMIATSTNGWSNLSSPVGRKQVLAFFHKRTVTDHRELGTSEGAQIRMQFAPSRGKLGDAATWGPSAFPMLLQASETFVIRSQDVTRARWKGLKRTKVPRHAHLNSSFDAKERA